MDLPQHQLNSVWIHENPAEFNTTTLTHFQENTQAFSLNHSQAVCHYTAYSPILLVAWEAKALPETELVLN